jgi:hypothetical protein
MVLKQRDLKSNRSFLQHSIVKLPKLSVIAEVLAFFADMDIPETVKVSSVKTVPEIFTVSCA